MCGRYTQTSDTAALRERFGLHAVRAEAEPRFNIAPTTSVPVVMLDTPGKVLDLLRWGLVPAYAKSLKATPHPINARAETVASSGMFRRLLARRRCLILADGFYEWRGPKARRQPVRIQLADGKPFAFAGLWDCWRDPEDPQAAELRTCTIVTTTANELVSPIHDRMPVILPPGDEDRWLDPAQTDTAALVGMLRPFASERMKLYAVPDLVNDVRNRGPECIQPIG